MMHFFSEEWLKLQKPAFVKKSGLSTSQIERCKNAFKEIQDDLEHQWVVEQLEPYRRMRDATNYELATGVEWVCKCKQENFAGSRYCVTCEEAEPAPQYASKDLLGGTMTRRLGVYGSITSTHTSNATSQKEITANHYGPTTSTRTSNATSFLKPIPDHSTEQEKLALAQMLEKKKGYSRPLVPVSF